MEKKRESGDILEHMLLEEVKINNIKYIEPPVEWNPELHHNEPYVPPVLIKEKLESETLPDENAKEYSLLAHHRSFWKACTKGQFTVRALVVHSNVQISLAHESINNCTEEALLFDGLLRNDLCENRSRLSELLGYSRARITQILNLLKLPYEMRQKLLLTDDISEFQLRPIIRIANTKAQREMFNHLIKGKLTGRQMALFADGKEKVDVSKPQVDLAVLMNEDLPSDETEVTEYEDSVEFDNESASSPVIQPSHVTELMQFIKLRNPGWEAEAEKKGVSSIDMEFLKGIFKLRNGLYSEAVSILEDLVGNNPDYGPAYFYIGKCYNLLGKPDSAENALRTALDLIPDEPDYLVELAIVLEKMKRGTEASAFYKKASVIRRKSQMGESR